MVGALRSNPGAGWRAGRGIPQRASLGLLPNARHFQVPGGDAVAMRLWDELLNGQPNGPTRQLRQRNERAAHLMGPPPKPRVFRLASRFAAASAVGSLRRCQSLSTTPRRTLQRLVL